VKIVNPDYSVEMIVQRMREAAAQNAVSTNGDDYPRFERSAVDGRFNADVDIHPITLQPPFSTNPDDRYHVNDLLKFSDRQFLQNAYRAILKRPADDEGMQRLLEALRSGHLNKIDVLGQLRYSKEGREKAVEIEGLRLTAMTRKLYRLPILGYLVNLVVALGRLPSMVQHQRAFESHVAAQQETLVSQINHIGRTVVSQANQTADVIAQRSDAIRELEQQTQGVREQLDFLTAEHAAAHEVVLARVSELSRYIEDRVNDESNERHAAVRDLFTKLSEATAAWHEDWNKSLASLREEATSAFAAEHGARASLATDLRRELSSSLSAMVDRHQQLASELTLQSHRVARLIDTTSGRAHDDSQRQVFAEEAAHSLDAFFASFDEQFRGNRAEIKERLKVYLPYVIGLKQPLDKVIDLGCGRGEWLELLKDTGQPATGVDSNTVLAQQCRVRGLDAIEAELHQYLKEQPDNSASVITGFHIVEHLPIEKLVTVLNETMRVLSPGGVLIVETPNPRNVLVGTCNFYFDPTHRNPIPSEVLKFLVESRGFNRIEVLQLNPSDEAPVAGESDLVNRFNDYFYGPMDYGIVAFKPPTLPTSNN
jgi:ubiquinone/menaquinone biosynthesis C-methylase UbiE